MSEYSSPPEDFLPPGSPIPPGSSEYVKPVKKSYTKKQKALLTILITATASIIIFTVILPILFFGFLIYQLAPKADRFDEINNALSIMDYKNAGEIISEEYSGGSSIAPVYFDATIKGEEAFERLSNKYIDYFDYEECNVKKDILTCTIGEPDITIFKGDGITKIKMSGY